MPTVSELKTEAQRAEQEGDLVEAIAIYQHILHHLAEWPEALAEELNLFTRVGDLRVELHQPARAYAAYRHAAEQYARLGSVEDIKQLCARMINVVPASADAYAHFAKRLLDYGHLREALDLVRAYATEAHLKDVAHTINALEGRSNGETRALLTDLLDTIERDIEGQATAARSVLEKIARDAESEVGRAQVTPAQPAAASRKEPKSPSAKAPAPVGPRPAPAPARPTGAAAGPASSRPTPKTDPPVPAASKERTQRPLKWQPFGVGGAIAAGVVLLIVAVVRVSGGDSEAPAADAMAAMIDTSPGAVDADSPAIAPNQDTAETTPSVQRQQTPPPPAQPEPVPVRPEPVQTEPPQPDPVRTPAEVDSTPVAPDTGITQPDSSAAITEPLVLGDLPIQSVAPIEFRGQSGFRVVHLLDSGAEFVVESYPVDSTSARRYPIGSVIVNNIPPDTKVSIVRFDERYLVFASGTVPEDSARVLVELLRVRESPD